MFVDRKSFQKPADRVPVRARWSLLPGRKGAAFDRTLGQPLVREGLAALHDGDWTALAEMYRGQAGCDRYLWIELMAGLWPLERPLPQGARHGAALAVAGGLLVTLGWRHRGAAPARSVGPAQRDAMQSHLRHARTALELSRRAGPDVVALGFAVRAAMGMSDHDGVAAQTDLLLGCDEPCLLADLALMTAWEAKWGATQEDMWAVVHDRGRQGPAWTALEMRARLEDCVWHEHVSDVPGAAEAHRARRDDPSYTAEMLQMQAGALRGLTPDQPHARRLVAHNVIGASMACLVSWEAAAPHLEAIGPHLSEGAWAQVEDVTDPARAIVRMRRRAGLEPLTG